MAQDITETRLRELQEIDNRLCCLSHKFSLVQIYMLSHTPLFGPWYKDRLIVSGSQTEGELCSRMFRRGKHVNESDFMFSLGDIKDPVNRLQPIQDSPGYYKVIYNGILKECFCDGVREKFLETSNEQQSESGFLTRSSVLNFTESMFSKTRAKKRANELTADTVFQPQVPSKETVVTFKKKGPSVATTVVLESHEKFLCEIRVDTVPCFKLSSWPDEWGYKEFLDRNRKWPSNPQVVKGIQDMVHLVAKPSPKLEDESEREECWRISFSKAEMRLKSEFSDDERRVYLLFKILFYANIKNIKINGKTMPSYFCKTTMLWVMEEGADFCQKDLWEAIRRLFGKLRQFLESKDGLPNFFWPSINLLEGYPQELITECSNMAGNITQHPQEFFPPNFDEVFQKLKKMVDRVQEIQAQDFLNKLHTYVRERDQHLRGCTAIEFIGQSSMPINWRVQFLFHPFVRAVARTWIRRKFYHLRVALSCNNCLPYYRHGEYETID